MSAKSTTSAKKKPPVPPEPEDFSNRQIDLFRGKRIVYFSLTIDDK